MQSDKYLYSKKKNTDMVLPLSTLYSIRFTLTSKLVPKKINSCIFFLSPT